MKQRRRGLTTAAVLIIAGCGAVVAVDSPGRIERAVAPPHMAEVATPAPRTDQELAYLASVEPLVERLVGEGRTLAELGSARSRNILELRTRAERFRDTAAEITTLRTRGEVPPRLEPYAVELAAGVSAALAEINAAEAAVLRFNWTEVESSVALFSAAVDRIAAASGQLE